MKKKTKNSSSMERKKIVKTSANNKKDIQSKPKQTLNKSVEKKKKIVLGTESGLTNTSIEVKSQRDKIHLAKQNKDKSGNKKSTNTRSAVTNKSKEYENTLNKLSEDNEYEKEKEYDFFNFKVNDSSKKKEKEKNKKSTNYTEESKKKEKNKKYDDNEESSDEEDNNDFIHRTLYKASNDNKGLSDEKNKSTQNKDDKDKYKEKKIKEQPNTQSNNKFSISMEKTDDMRYNIGDKKIYSNINGKQKNTKTESNYDNNDNYPKYEKRNIYSPKSGDKFKELTNERTIDLFVIDGDDDEIIVSSKYKKKIDRKRNKFKEIFIEKYDAATPIRNDKLTGFVLIRKNKGKKAYDLQLEDDIDKINSLFKNKDVMIKNEIIQIIPLKKLLFYQNESKNYDDKIFKLQSELNKKEINSKDKESDKLKEKERQISFLKSKNDELNNLVKDQEQQMTQNERELKQIKTSYDKLKEAYQLLEKEKKALVEQAESYKLKKKVVQFQLDEKNDQKNIKEMKERIKKYKDELRKVPPPEERHQIALLKVQDPMKSPRKKHKDSVDFPESKENKVIQLEKEEEEDDDGMGVEGADFKAKKMKNAVNRFKKKYHDVIKEEKKNAKMKEKERVENEERELDDDNNEEEIRKQKEQEELRQREERERREREEWERKEREREERERREREEWERKEREREERERKEKEEWERKEREREERERKEKEERERREREEKERKERERKEREKREKEERERKEKEKKEREKREREERERKERERKEKEKRDKEEKEKKEKEKKDKPAMGGGKAAPNKMMGGNFAKMLADKLKMPGGGGMGMMGMGGPKKNDKPPIVEKNVDVAQLIEEKPFVGRSAKRKPTKKVFVEELNDDDE